MPIDSRTEVFISVSTKPGDFGATVYNELFRRCGINAIYVPRTAPDAASLATAIRTLDIRGCSVSMPLKSAVLPELDAIDPIAFEVQSVNTICNLSGILTGYNTDVFGATRVLEPILPRSAWIYGSGSVSRAIHRALRDLGCERIMFSGRSAERVSSLCRQTGAEFVADPQTIGDRVDVMVSATPAGGSVDGARCLQPLVSRARYVFDVVVSRTTTPLARLAAESGKQLIEGWQMSRYQLQRQFEAYTSIKVEAEAIDTILTESFFQR